MSLIRYFFSQNMQISGIFKSPLLLPFSNHLLFYVHSPKTCFGVHILYESIQGGNLLVYCVGWSTDRTHIARVYT